MEERIERALEAFRKNGFRAEFVKDREEARKRLLELIPEKAKVGIPGTKTVRQTGIVEELKKRGQELFDHWEEGLKPDEVLQCRRSQLQSDVLLVSANALTESGELMNSDGVGNRVASMIFGPGQVIVVAGINKLVKDLDAAEDRIRNIAAPRRAAELNLKPPCVETGKCSGPHHAQCICRVTTIISMRPSLTQFTVILVGEELGN
jgi:L-lactate utilization protein LutB